MAKNNFNNKQFNDTQKSNADVIQENKIETTLVETKIDDVVTIQPTEQVNEIKEITQDTKEQTIVSTEEVKPDTVGDDKETASMKEDPAVITQTTIVSTSVVNTIINSEGMLFTPELQVMVDKLKATNCQVTTATLDTIIHYCKTMKPGKQMSPADGGRNQVTLYRAFTYMVNSLSKDFNTLFAVVLKIVDETKETGAFRPSHSCRFTHDMKLDRKDLESFTNFINLLYVTSTVSGRQHSSKQVDLVRTLAHGFNDEARQKISTFYNR